MDDDQTDLPLLFTPGVNHTTVPNKLREPGIPTRDTHGRPRVEAGDPR